MKPADKVFRGIEGLKTSDLVGDQVARGFGNRKGKVSDRKKDPVSETSGMQVGRRNNKRFSTRRSRCCKRNGKAQEKAYIPENMSFSFALILQ